jgi:hypothetical protein
MAGSRAGIYFWILSSCIPIPQFPCLFEQINHLLENNLEAVENFNCTEIRLLMLICKILKL